ncbi:MAG: Flagellum-specific ATP synthase FliI [uncultured Solirubrobacteraceae bacterium]|uniref:Flagellum-specific ATP synthase FliI n=1 Tax=uncultured Solirubrobacteraceae bacterium TaxID=1162706 RepID=A0A6J4SMG8_9ACTN|nr:MAG: Flagellum-specific ATP synthase FliI [uncultured Solirubrobacteraceae bacterium]
MRPDLFPRLEEALAHADLHRRHGQVRDLIGLIVEVTGLEAEVGEVCHIDAGRRRRPVPAEVVGFRAGRTLLMALGDPEGIGPGAPVEATGRPLQVAVSDGLLGRAIDGLGRPIDGLGEVAGGVSRAVAAAPPDPLSRPRISERMTLGVRALDALVPCGHGQRLGIFAGSGVGKSSLLGMIARSSSAQVNVICLVGERGREVREFMERDLGPEGLARSVVVVATSDQPALVRIKAALTATTIAEHFRDQGCEVLLMMDSVTRFAMAQREVGLAIGEPPATRGYTPSVFALLPKLLERSGTSPKGSITGLYTVLVDGDDMNEPIADAVRSILDGHVVLSRDLAHAGHYPAIDVLASVSRLVGEVVTPETRRDGNEVRRLMAAYKEKQDLIAIGAYQPGADPLTDAAIAARGHIETFLQQSVTDLSTAEDADAGVAALAALGGAVERPPALGLEAPPAMPGAAGGDVPLHSAIPPLNLAA